MKIEKTQSNTNFNGIFRLLDKRLLIDSDKYNTKIVGAMNEFVRLNKGYTHTVSGTPYIFSKAADDKIFARYLTARNLDFDYSNRHEFFDQVVNTEIGLTSNRDAQRVAGLIFSKFV